jgi:hypothetical protein
MVFNENQIENSEENVIDDYSDELSELFERHKDRVPPLIDSANHSGPNFSSKNITEITGINEKAAKYLKYALVALVHQYVSHREELQQHASNSKVDRSIIDNLFLFLNQLSKDGLSGLDTVFYSDASLDKMSILSEITDPRLLLSKITDHDGKTRAYLPLVRITMTFTSESNEENDRTVFLSLDDLKSYIRYLDHSYNSLRKEVEEYRKLVGDLPLVTGG